MVEPAGGTDFKAAHPDESVFGERKFDAAADYLNKGSDEAENKNSMFMSFIMPIRMNR